MRFLITVHVGIKLGRFTPWLTDSRVLHATERATTAPYEARNLNPTLNTFCRARKI